MASLSFLVGGPRNSVHHVRSLYSELLFHITSEKAVDPRQREESAPGSPRHRLSLWKKQLITRSNNNNDLALEAAFSGMAATRSTQNTYHEYQDNEQQDEEAAAHAHRSAQAVERVVVQIIRTIGQVVNHAVDDQQQRTARNPDHTPGQLRYDDVFEYFCEKAIHGLLVDIVCEKPSTAYDENSTCFRSVVWTAKVKAEALRTVSLLISCVRDPSSLYYILSHHWINQLISTMLPLSQWTDPALEFLIPPYIDLLKNVALVLDDSPHLFSFLTTTTNGTTSKTFFTLFTATLETCTSDYATSNSFVHATCLNLLVDLMQIQDPTIQTWVHEEAHAEHILLTHHLCDLLLRRYRRMVNLTNGPVVDSVRCEALTGQLEGLNDQIDVLNDIFDCEIRGLNVRLCEVILQRVIRQLWRHVVFDESIGNPSSISGPDSGSLSDLSILSNQEQTPLPVGLSDADVIPEREALMHVSFIMLATIFHRLRYRPLVRMIATALFHPETTHLFVACSSSEPKTTPLAQSTTHHGVSRTTIVYRYTPALHQVIQGEDPEGDGDDGYACNSTDNLFREQVRKALGGEFGYWYAMSASILLEFAIQSPSLDEQTLVILKLLPFDQSDPQALEFGK